MSKSTRVSRCDHCSEATMYCRCNGSGHFPQSYEEQIREAYREKLNNFTDFMLARFDEGRKKYANHLSEINYDFEKKCELADLLNYTWMEEINNELK